MDKTASHGQGRKDEAGTLGLKEYVNMHRDQLSRSIDLVVTDKDGTTGCWASYWVPAWLQEQPRLASCLNISEAEVCTRMARIIGQTGTHENPWALELAYGELWEGTVPEFFDCVVRPFWSAMEAARKKWLRPYPTVTRTLQLLKLLEIPVAVLSDAPFHMVATRYHETLEEKAEGAVLGLYGIECPEPHPSVFAHGDSRWLEHGRELVAKMSSVELKVQRKRVLKHHKPHPSGIRQVLEDFGITDGKRVLVIGDSVKDGWAAEEIGAKYIRAYYGQWPPEYEDLLRVALKPLSSDGPAKCPDRPNPVPDDVVMAYEGLLRHIGLGGERRPTQADDTLVMLG